MTSHTLPQPGSTESPAPSLRRLPVYNPRIQTDAEVIASFVARRPLFHDLMRELRSEPASGRAQPHLIIGARGMGKTTLLMRLAAELRRPEFAGRFVPLVFAEEQYSVDRLSKFWLNCLDSLADVWQKRGESQRLAEIDSTVARCAAQGRGLSRDQDSPLATTVFEELVRLTGNERPVLLVDNVQLMFERLTSQQQHALRQVLMRAGGPVLIAAAPHPVLETQDYGAPFYDLFKTHWLAPLSADEMRELLVELARLQGKTELAGRVAAQPGRLKTLHLLTGGNPRAAVLLFHLYAEGLSSHVYSDLEGVLDLVTPLYKARFEELAPQMQMVAAALAEAWDPCTARQLADLTSLPITQISPQLQRLAKLGFIESVELAGGDQGWQIAERLFNLWYLMRLASRRQRRGVEFLTRFLEAFFEPGERDQFARSLRHELQTNSDRLLVAMSVAETVSDPLLRDDLQRQVQLSSLNLQAKAGRERLRGLLDLDALPVATLEFQQLRQRLQNVLGEEISSQSKSLVNHLLSSWSLWVDHDLETLMALVSESSQQRVALVEELRSERETLVGNYGETPVEWLEQRLASGQIRQLFNVEDWERTILLAESECPPVLRLIWETCPVHLFRYLSEDVHSVLHRKLAPLVVSDETIVQVLNWGNDCFYRGLTSSAEAAYRQIIELDSDLAVAWNNLANLLLIHFSNHLEAEAAYRRAIELSSTFAAPWNGLGNLLIRQARYREAEEACRKALDLDPHYATALLNLGFLFQQLARYEEAEAAYRKAIEIDEKFGFCWGNLGNLQLKRGLDEEAEAAYENAVRLDPRDSTAWNAYGNLLKCDPQRVAEAEKAYRKAIQFDPTFSQPWNGLGNLYADYRGDFAKAEECYRRSASLDSKRDVPKHNLVFLQRDFLAHLQSAAATFQQIAEPEDKGEWATWQLHRALFAAYRVDWEATVTSLAAALDCLDDSFSTRFHDDWIRASAVLIHLGFGARLLEFLERRSENVRLRPWFEAVRAAEANRPELLRNVAPEVRLPAEKLLAQIQQRLARLPASTCRRPTAVKGKRRGKKP